MLKTGLKQSQISTVDLIAVAKRAYPNGVAYNNGGGLMSDPALLTHILGELSDYQDLGGLDAAPVERRKGLVAAFDELARALPL